jgi:hypothetical protein
MPEAEGKGGAMRPGTVGGGVGVGPMPRRTDQGRGEGGAMPPGIAGGDAM